MLDPSEQGQCLISYRKTIIDQHEKEIHYLQDVFMAMEQNYIDSEYESKLEFQSMWDDLKNKVEGDHMGRRWERSESRMLKPSGAGRDPFNKHHQ